MRLVRSVAVSVEVLEKRTAQIVTSGLVVLLRGHEKVCLRGARLSLG